MQIKVGQTLKLAVTDSGAAVASLSFTSLNPDLLTVDSAGKVTGVAVGKSMVQIKNSADGTTVDQEIDVIPASGTAPSHAYSTSLNAISAPAALTATPHAALNGSPTVDLAWSGLDITTPVAGHPPSNVYIIRSTDSAQGVLVLNAAGSYTETLSSVDGGKTVTFTVQTGYYNNATGVTTLGPVQASVVITQPVSGYATVGASTIDAHVAGFDVTTPVNGVAPTQVHLTNATGASAYLPIAANGTFSVNKATFGASGVLTLKASTGSVDGPAQLALNFS